MSWSSGSVWQHARRVAGVATLAVVFGFGPAAAHAACVGDCDASGDVRINELILLVDIALGTAPLTNCSGGDQNGDGEIAVNEIITAVNNALAGCSSEVTPTPTTTVTPSPIEELTTTPTPGPTQKGVLSVADAVARNTDGVAVHLGETVTTEGVLTVSAGIFANNKLKVFAQDGDAGIMVYHQSAADVDAFHTGQRLRATGVIRQEDPTSDANPANGTVLIDISLGAVLVVSDGNPLPDPQAVTLATLNAQGDAYTGSLVRVVGVRKASGNWPTVGSKSTQVEISDDGGTSTVVLRLQRNTITEPLVSKLNAIGNGPFTLTGIVLQDDENGDGKLLTDFEIWLRGADDVVGG